MSNFKIMVVDDEPLITKSLEIFISFSFDADVLTFNNPVDAIKAFEDIKPQLVISDFMMPMMNGLEMLKKIRALSPDVVTILLTGYADKENAIRCINEVGLYYYCEKPWDNASLTKIIENALEKFNLKAQLQKKIIQLEESNNKIRRLYSLLKKDFDQEVDNVQNILITLANMIEAKDQYTDDHIRRVGTLCRAIGEEMGFDESKLRHLEMSGIIHDIGKIGISENILNKPGKLTPEEFQIMKKHPIIGYEICLPLNITKHCLDPIRHHHEKLDGSGYPDGLKGDEVTIESRIVAVADMFDALYSDRPYREKLDFFKIKEILEEDARKGLIDEEIVKILFKVYDKLVAEGIFE
jgi:putative two-component system response regulator